MREHGSLRLAGGTACILQEGDIIKLHICSFEGRQILLTFTKTIIEIKQRRAIIGWNQAFYISCSEIDDHTLKIWHTVTDRAGNVMLKIGLI